MEEIFLEYGFLNIKLDYKKGKYCLSDTINFTKEEQIRLKKLESGYIFYDTEFSLLSKAISFKIPYSVEIKIEYYDNSKNEWSGLICLNDLKDKSKIKYFEKTPSFNDMDFDKFNYWIFPPTKKSNTANIGSMGDRKLRFYKNNSDEILYAFLVVASANLSESQINKILWFLKNMKLDFIQSKSSLYSYEFKLDEEMPNLKKWLDELEKAYLQVANTPHVTLDKKIEYSNLAQGKVNKNSIISYSQSFGKDKVGYKITEETTDNYENRFIYQILCYIEAYLKNLKLGTEDRFSEINRVKVEAKYKKVHDELEKIRSDFKEEVNKLENKMTGKSSKEIVDLLNKINLDGKQIDKCIEVYDSLCKDLEACTTDECILKAQIKFIEKILHFPIEKRLYYTSLIKKEKTLLPIIKSFKFNYKEFVNVEIRRIKKLKNLSLFRETHSLTNLDSVCFEMKPTLPILQNSNYLKIWLLYQENKQLIDYIKLIRYQSIPIKSMWKLYEEWVYFRLIYFLHRKLTFKLVEAFDREKWLMENTDAKTGIKDGAYIILDSPDCFEPVLRLKITYQQIHNLSDGNHKIPDITIEIRSKENDVILKTIILDPKYQDYKQIPSAFKEQIKHIKDDYTGKIDTNPPSFICHVTDKEEEAIFKITSDVIDYLDQKIDITQLEHVKTLLNKEFSRLKLYNALKKFNIDEEKIEIISFYAKEQFYTQFGGDKIRFDDSDFITNTSKYPDHMYGAFTFIPDDNDLNLKLFLMMIFEYHLAKNKYTYYDICWDCMNDENVTKIPLKTRSDFVKYHYQCRKCDNFWVKTHCSSTICKNEHLLKHYINYHEDISAWNVKCPECGEGFKRTSSQKNLSANSLTNNMSQEELDFEDVPF